MTCRLMVRVFDEPNPEEVEGLRWTVAGWASVHARLGDGWAGHPPPATKVSGFPRSVRPRHERRDAYPLMHRPSELCKSPPQRCVPSTRRSSGIVWMGATTCGLFNPPVRGLLRFTASRKRRSRVSRSERIPRRRPRRRRSYATGGLSRVAGIRRGRDHQRVTESEIDSPNRSRYAGCQPRDRPFASRSHRFGRRPERPPRPR